MSSGYETPLLTLNIGIELNQSAFICAAATRAFVVI